MTVTLNLGAPESNRTLQEIMDAVVRSKRLLFVSGAGISCSAGIPDFRSMDGLYSTCIADRTSIKGKDLFDISLFNRADTTAAFYKFMADLRTSTLQASPTTTHKFLKTLKDRGSLLRTYTQNIDGLEAQAGLILDSANLHKNDGLQLHGNIHRLRCFLCSENFDYTKELLGVFQAGEAPACPLCADKCAIRIASGRRPIAIGTLRPDIVLYGEAHPSGDLIASACAADIRKKPDCLIIAGTSLKVPGFKTLIKDLAKAVHAQKGLVIFVNLTDVGAAEWNKVIDYHVKGSSDGFVNYIKASRPSFFQKQTTLDAIPRTKRQSTSKNAKLEVKIVPKLPSPTSLDCAPRTLTDVSNLPLETSRKTIKVVIVKNELGKENIDPRDPTPSRKRSADTNLGVIDSREDRRVRRCVMV